MIEMHDRKKVIELLKRSEVFFGDLTYDGIKISTKDVAKLIEDQPEIVHCQDCKHGHKCEFSIRCENKNMPPMFGQHFPENWFCADGERKIETVRGKRSKLVGEVCDKGILWTNIETKEQTLENYD